MSADAPASWECLVDNELSFEGDFQTIMDDQTSHVSYQFVDGKTDISGINAGIANVAEEINNLLSHDMAGKLNFLDSIKNVVVEPKHVSVNFKVPLETRYYNEAKYDEFYSNEFERVDVDANEIGVKTYHHPQLHLPVNRTFNAAALAVSIYDYYKTEPSIDINSLGQLEYRNKSSYFNVLNTLCKSASSVFVVGCGRYPYVELDRLEKSKLFHYWNVTNTNVTYKIRKHLKKRAAVVEDNNEDDDDRFHMNEDGIDYVMANDIDVDTEIPQGTQYDFCITMIDPMLDRKVQIEINSFIALDCYKETLRAYVERETNSNFPTRHDTILFPMSFHGLVNTSTFWDDLDKISSVRVRIAGMCPNPEIYSDPIVAASQNVRVLGRMEDGRYLVESLTSKIVFVDEAFDPVVVCQRAFDAGFVIQLGTANNPNLFNAFGPPTNESFLTVTGARFSKFVFSTPHTILNQQLAMGMNNVLHNQYFVNHAQPITPGNVFRFLVSPHIIFSPKIDGEGGLLQVSRNGDIYVELQNGMYWSSSGSKLFDRQAVIFQIEAVMKGNVIVDFVVIDLFHKIDGDVNLRDASFAWRLCYINHFCAHLKFKLQFYSNDLKEVIPLSDEGIVVNYPLGSISLISGSKHIGFGTQYVKHDKQYDALFPIMFERNGITESLAVEYYIIDDGNKLALKFKRIRSNKTVASTPRYMTKMDEFVEMDKIRRSHFEAMDKFYVEGYGDSIADTPSNIKTMSAHIASMIRSITSVGTWYNYIDPGLLIHILELDHSVGSDDCHVCSCYAKRQVGKYGYGVFPNDLPESRIVTGVSYREHLDSGVKARNKNRAEALRRRERAKAKNNMKPP